MPNANKVALDFKMTFMVFLRVGGVGTLRGEGVLGFAARAGSSATPMASAEFQNRAALRA